MRNISVQEFELHPADYVAQVEAGARLTLLRGGKAVAEVLPASSTPAETEYPKQWASEEERLAAVEDLMQILRRGWDLGCLKITDRDALYDRGE